MSIQFKRVTNDDIDKIVFLDKIMRIEEPEVFNEYNEHLYRDKWIKYPIENNSYSDIILCLDGDEVVGRVDLMYEQSYMDFAIVGYVDWIYIRTKYRGKGIGKILLKEAEKQFKEKGCSKYYLFIAENKQALAFYDSTDLEIKSMKTGAKDFK